MKIRLTDKHELNSDEYCCWIEEKRISKEGNEYGVRVTGYCSTVERLFADFANKAFMGSKAESIKDLSDDLEDLKAEMAAMAKGLEALL